MGHLLVSALLNIKFFLEHSGHQDMEWRHKNDAKVVSVLCGETPCLLSFLSLFHRVSCTKRTMLCHIFGLLIHELIFEGRVMVVVVSGGSATYGAPRHKSFRGPTLPPPYSRVFTNGHCSYPPKRNSHYSFWLIRHEDLL